MHSSAPSGNTPEVNDSRSQKFEIRPAGLSGRWKVAGVCIFLAAIIWAVYGQTLHFEFVNYDDDEQIYEHPVIKDGLSLPGIAWVFTHSDDGHWIPLNKISHMLDCQFYGLRPAGHHLTNVLLHTATAILLFLVLRRMMELRPDKGIGTADSQASVLWRSAFVAAVFAVHPLRVESVAWVAERKDVLSGLFFILTLWAYVRYAQNKASLNPQTLDVARRSGDGSTLNYALSLLFFACGLMSKAIVATLPLLLLLLDYWPLGRFGPPGSMAAIDRKKRLSVSKRLILEKIPFLGVIIAVGMGLLFSRDRNNVVVAVAIRTGQGLVPHKDLNQMERTGDALLTPFVYLKQLFFPASLAVSSPPGHSVPRWEMFGAVILLAAISGIVLARRRKQTYLVVGWFWYLAMLAPVLMLIQKGAEFRCDRYTYLSQIGLYLLLAWAAADLCAGWRHGRLVLGGCATIVVIALIFCARVQTSYWRNSESLWVHTLDCTPDNVLAHNNLGNVLFQKGRVDEAIAHYQKAIQIMPDFAEAQSNLGNALLQKGDVGAAIAHCQKALQSKPVNAKAHSIFGNALLQKGDVGAAIAQYQKALQIKPDFAEVHGNLGNALVQKGSLDEAITHYQMALQIKPDYVNALNNLAWLLATCPDVHIRDGVQAVNYGVISHVDTLAAAYAEAGRFDDAIAAAQKACALAAAAGAENLLEQSRERLALYRARQPYHEAAGKVAPAAP